MILKIVQIIIGGSCIMYTLYQGYIGAEPDFYIMFIAIIMSQNNKWDNH